MVQPWGVLRSSAFVHGQYSNEGKRLGGKGKHIVRASYAETIHKVRVAEKKPAFADHQQISDIAGVMLME